MFGECLDLRCLRRCERDPWSHLILEEVCMPTSFGFLSTYPPTQCGLATFTAALRQQVVAAGHRAGVVRVLDGDDPASSSAVVAELVHGRPGSIEAAVVALNDFDVAVVQHEFGIYGGADGDGILDVLSALTVPVIVVLHTVLVAPTSHQRAVLEEVAHHARAVVTMTETARRRLADHYDVDPSKVLLIPHGAPEAGAGSRRRPGQPPVLLTWGLLGPGKGIERVIDALPSLRDLVPTPHYLVVGETHPRVLEREGERYRVSLRARAVALGVEDMISFRAGYLPADELAALTASADVVVLPYDSKEQVTSGVLIEAVAARRPVVATAFAHAVELLGPGAGLVVDHDDPAALAEAIRQVLCEPAVVASMAARASQLAPDLLWSAVTDRYLDLAQALMDAALPAWPAGRVLPGGDLAVSAGPG
jgi:glycosyltransferase involved in cell wall biosynthesis